MKIIASVAFFFLVSVALAQLQHPKISPAATVVQEVGFTTISVVYSRPSVRGRKIFGDLVPYNRIWRVGANESTKITFDSDVIIFNDSLSKGTYALYAFPQEDIWQIVFHKNITHWGDGREKYNPEEDALRVKIRPFKKASFQENFSIAFDSISHNGANLLLHWENTIITIPISVDTHTVMKQQIVEKITHQPKAQTYYEAARYMVEQKEDYTLALEYLNKAIELGGDTYYFHRVKSLTEAALGDYDSAISSAQKSLELAQKEGKDEFVRMNQKNIDFWKEQSKVKN